MRQAQNAPGNISATTRTIKGVHHTLSVWTDEAAMRAYLIKGDHLEAMKIFSQIATGKTYGYVTAIAPDWDDARYLWETKGRDVRGAS